MAAFDGLSDLILAGTGGNNGNPETIFFQKIGRIGNSLINTTTNVWHSSWLHDGIPSAGATPGAVAAPTNATTGSFKQTDPGGGRQKWLMGGGVFSIQAGMLMIYDRLLHIGGLSGTVTTPQTVGGSLTRYTDGVGNVALAEIYAAVGSTARTITMSYTDPVNGAGRTSVAAVFGGSGLQAASNCAIMPLASTDTGVSAVASVTLSASTGGAGNFGVTVAHPLLMIPVLGSGGSIRDLVSSLPSLVEVRPGACLSALWFSTVGGEIPLLGWAPMVER